MTTNSTSAGTCREALEQAPTGYRKDGEPRITNRWPARCALCDTALAPGEGRVGSKDERTGRIKWICGAGRWERP